MSRSLIHVCGTFDEVASCWVFVAFMWTTAALNDLKTRLPPGDFRTFTRRYTGIEKRQDPNTMCIEIGQESYIGGKGCVAVGCTNNHENITLLFVFIYLYY